jgi:hypothetical protein
MAHSRQKARDSSSAGHSNAKLKRSDVIWLILSEKDVTGGY